MKNIINIGLVSCVVLILVLGNSRLYAEQAMSPQVPALFGYRLGMSEYEVNGIRTLDNSTGLRAVIRKVTIERVEYRLIFTFIKNQLGSVLAEFDPEQFGAVHQTLNAIYGIGREGTSLQSGDRIDKGQFMWDLQDGSRLYLLPWSNNGQAVIYFENYRKYDTD